MSNANHSNTTYGGASADKFAIVNQQFNSVNATISHDRGNYQMPKIETSGKNEIMSPTNNRGYINQQLHQRNMTNNANQSPNSVKKSSTPLFLAIGRLTKQSKEQFRKFNRIIDTAITGTQKSSSAMTLNIGGQATAQLTTNATNNIYIGNVNYIQTADGIHRAKEIVISDRQIMENDQSKLENIRKLQGGRGDTYHYGFDSSLRNQVTQNHQSLRQNFVSQEQQQPITAVSNEQHDLNTSLLLEPFTANNGSIQSQYHTMVATSKEHSAQNHTHFVGSARPKKVLNRSIYNHRPQNQFRNNAKVAEDIRILPSILKGSEQLNLGGVPQQRTDKDQDLKFRIQSEIGRYRNQNDIILLGNQRNLDHSLNDQSNHHYGINQKRAQNVSFVQPLAIRSKVNQTMNRSSKKISARGQEQSKSKTYSADNQPKISSKTHLEKLQPIDRNMINNQTTLTKIEHLQLQQQEKGVDNQLRQIQQEIKQKSTQLANMQLSPWINKQQRSPSNSNSRHADRRTIQDIVYNNQNTQNDQNDRGNEQRMRYLQQIMGRKNKQMNRNYQQNQDIRQSQINAKETEIEFQGFQDTQANKAQVNENNKKERNISPELKRIIHNLTNNRHLNRYCKCCRISPERLVDSQKLTSYDLNNLDDFIKQMKQLNQELFNKKLQKKNQNTQKWVGGLPPKSLEFKSMNQSQDLGLSHDKTLEISIVKQQEQFEAKMRQYYISNHIKQRTPPMQMHSKRASSNLMRHNIPHSHVRHSHNISMHEINQAVNTNNNNNHRSMQSLSQQRQSQQKSVRSNQNNKSQKFQSQKSKTSSAMRNLSPDVQDRLLDQYDKQRHMCTTVHRPGFHKEVYTPQVTHKYLKKKSRINPSIARHVMSRSESQYNEDNYYEEEDDHQIPFFGLMPTEKAHSETREKQSIGLSVMDFGVSSKDSSSISLRDYSQQVDQISRAEQLIQTIRNQASIQMQTQDLPETPVSQKQPLKEFNEIGIETEQLVETEPQPIIIREIRQILPVSTHVFGKVSNIYDTEQPEEWVEEEPQMMEFNFTDDWKHSGLFQEVLSEHKAQVYTGKLDKSLQQFMVMPELSLDKHLSGGKFQPPTFIDEEGEEDDYEISGSQQFLIAPNANTAKIKGNERRMSGMYDGTGNSIGLKPKNGKIERIQRNPITKIEEIKANKQRAASQDSQVKEQSRSSLTGGSHQQQQSKNLSNFRQSIGNESEVNIEEKIQDQNSKSMIVDPRIKNDQNTTLKVGWNESDSLEHGRIDKPTQEQQLNEQQMFRQEKEPKYAKKSTGLQLRYVNREQEADLLKPSSHLKHQSMQQIDENYLENDLRNSDQNLNQKINIKHNDKHYHTQAASRTSLIEEQKDNQATEQINEIKGSTVNDSQNNFNKSQKEYDYLNPDRLEIYYELECIYMASLLRKKAQTYNNPETLVEIHDKAKTTLKVLTNNLVQGDLSLEHIFQMYQALKRQNAIKLLLRCKKMYEARVEVKKIIQLLIIKWDLFQYIQRLLRQKRRIRPYTPYELELVECGCRLLQKLDYQLRVFKTENKIFKARFMFFEKDQYIEVHREMQELCEFRERMYNAMATLEKKTTQKNSDQEQEADQNEIKVDASVAKSNDKLKSIKEEKIEQAEYKQKQETPKANEGEERKMIEEEVKQSYSVMPGEDEGALVKIHTYQPPKIVQKDSKDDNELYKSNNSYIEQMKLYQEPLNEEESQIQLTQQISVFGEHIISEENFQESDALINNLQFQSEFISPQPDQGSQPHQDNLISIVQQDKIHKQGTLLINLNQAQKLYINKPLDNQSQSSNQTFLVNGPLSQRIIMETQHDDDDYSQYSHGGMSYLSVSKQQQRTQENWFFNQQSQNQKIQLHEEQQVSNQALSQDKPYKSNEISDYSNSIFIIDQNQMKGQQHVIQELNANKHIDKDATPIKSEKSQNQQKFNYQEIQIEFQIKQSSKDTQKDLNGNLNTDSNQQKNFLKILDGSQQDLTEHIEILNQDDQHSKNQSQANKQRDPTHNVQSFEEKDENEKSKEIMQKSEKKLSLHNNDDPESKLKIDNDTREKNNKNDSMTSIQQLQQFSRQKPSDNNQLKDKNESPKHQTSQHSRLLQMNHMDWNQDKPIEKRYDISERESLLGEQIISYYDK